MRRSYVWDAEKKALVPKDEYYAARSFAPMVMPDIKGYQSMATGEWINSRSQHREHLKQHRLIEIGNERITPKGPQLDRKGIRKAAEDAVRHILG